MPFIYYNHTFETLKIFWSHFIYFMQYENRQTGLIIVLLIEKNYEKAIISDNYIWKCITDSV